MALFCRYGSNSREPLQGTPVILRITASFELWPPNSNWLGLCLSRQELDEVVKRYDNYCAKFSECLIDRIYTWTAGHAGAAIDLVRLILDVSV